MPTFEYKSDLPDPRSLPDVSTETLRDLLYVVTEHARQFNSETHSRIKNEVNYLMTHGAVTYPNEVMGHTPSAEVMRLVSTRFVNSRNVIKYWTHANWADYQIEIIGVGSAYGIFLGGELVGVNADGLFEFSALTPVTLIKAHATQLATFRKAEAEAKEREQILKAIRDVIPDPDFEGDPLERLWVLAYDLLPDAPAPVSDPDPLDGTADPVSDPDAIEKTPARSSEPHISASTLYHDVLQTLVADPNPTIRVAAYEMARAGDFAFLLDAALADIEARTPTTVGPALAYVAKITTHWRDEEKQKALQAVKGYLMGNDPALRDRAITELHRVMTDPTPADE